LLPLLPVLEFEAAFLPVGDDAPPHLEEALAFGAGLDRVVLNHGALDGLGAGLDLLHPAGFALVNDYGPTDRVQVPDQGATQRFGRSTAVGLNFPLLERHFTRRGWVVH